MLVERIKMDRRQKNVAKILMSYSAVVESTESKKKVTKKTVNL
jgi:hypothetical protein